jgi:osmotically inducible protein OsmC
MDGRVGTAKSDDGQSNLKLDRPVEMDGKAEGTNPEQLFAVGYAACFIGALRVVAGKRCRSMSCIASIALVTRFMMIC